MDTTDNNRKDNQNPDKNFPSKNFSQRFESQEVNDSEEKTSDASARENANTGDWEDMRDENKKADGYNSDTNDNTGGAGSTGSAATNS